jgi:hypothetical protein
MTLLEQLQKEYKFAVIRDEKTRYVWRFVFEDGRQYRFQEPPFFELHEAMNSETNARTAALKIGIAHTYPENDKSPPLTEEYLSQHKVEAFQLWTRLYGEVLFQDG